MHDNHRDLRLFPGVRVMTQYVIEGKVLCTLTSMSPLGTVADMLDADTLQFVPLGVRVYPFFSNQHIPSAIQLLMITQLAKACRLLHDGGYVHGDINSPNVVLTRSLDPQSTLKRFYAEGAVLVELVDFGGSKKVGDPCCCTNGIISAPELNAPFARLTLKVDIYAFSYLALEILLGRSAKVGEVLECRDYPLPSLAARLETGRSKNPEKRTSWAGLIQMLTFGLEALAAVE